EVSEPGSHHVPRLTTSIDLAAAAQQGADDQAEHQAWEEAQRREFKRFKSGPPKRQTDGFQESLQRHRRRAGKHSERPQRYRIRSILAHGRRSAPYGTPMIRAGQ